MADNQHNNNKFRKLVKKAGLPAVFLASAVALSGCVPEEDNSQISPYTNFLAAVDKGEVTQVRQQGQALVYTTRLGQGFKTYAPDNENVADVIRGKNVTLTVQPRPQGGGGGLLGMMLPFLMIGGVLWLMMRRAPGAGGGVGGMGASKAKMLNQVHGKVTFADVAGIDEAKEELQEVVEFLRNPGKFSRLGGKIPKGALLVGPPGTGKTLTARAVAGEAGVPFFTTSGSEFVEMYVGVGASRVRDMFAQAKKNAPCIIFIDEIDAVGRARSNGTGGGGNDEREQTLNQLLVEMDGFEGNDGVIIMAATNRPDILDPALKRPGRFDRQVTVGLPDVKGREKILAVHARKVPLGPDVDLRVVARGTPGFSGADLANLVNEAALMAARRNKNMIALVDFENAKDKIMMGPERKSLTMTDEQKRLTAYHEGGHAILSVLQPACDPIHKATIMPRGQALGMVVSLPEGDRVSLTREKAMADLVMTAGGRVAEELIFGEEKVTTGASGDIQQMTRLATAMVKEWGLSSEVGMIRHVNDNGSPFLECSESTKQLIDKEIKKLVDDAYARAKDLVTANIDTLHSLADALLEFETMTGHEVRALILEGKKPEPAPAGQPAHQPPPVAAGELRPSHVPQVPRRPPPPQPQV